MIGKRRSFLAALLLGAAGLIPAASGGGVPAQAAPSMNQHMSINCEYSPLCPDLANSAEVFGADEYVGHDEPSLLFYSDDPGSGNSNLYKVRLPTDPKQQPVQDGSGATWNFQLHPA